MAKRKSKASRSPARKPKVDMKIMVLIGVIALAGAVSAIYGSINAPAQEKAAEEGMAEVSEDVAGTETPNVNVGIVMESKLTTSPINSPIKLNWDLLSDRSASTDHTAVHYGRISVPEPSSPKDYGFSGKIMSGNLPGNFTDSVTIQEPGIYFFRAHAIVDGKHFWTDESELIVVNPTLQNSVRSLTLSGGDNEFVMNNEAAPATISAKFGENIRMKFRTPSKSVDPEGMTYRSEIYGFDTGNVKPGTETEVEFTTYLSGPITSHRTSTNELVGTIFVTVE